MNSINYLIDNSLPVDDIEIIGVDEAGQEDHAPQNVEIYDLDIPEADSPPIEVETVEPDTVEEVQAPAAPASVAQPEQEGLRRSTRVRSKPKQRTLTQPSPTLWQPS
jgi:hypothetical protein